MRYKLSSILYFLFAVPFYAQFQVNVKAYENFLPKEAYLYTLLGTQDVLVAKAIRSSNGWKVKVPDYYKGKLKLYFPENNTEIALVSENTDVDLTLKVSPKGVLEYEFRDAPNNFMQEWESLSQKKRELLPVYYQILNYYSPQSDFYVALQKEIAKLSNPSAAKTDFEFINFYIQNKLRLEPTDQSASTFSQEQLVDFLVRSNDLLESSGLMRTALVGYLENATQTDAKQAVDFLLQELNVESARGQIVLSEFIEIFDIYGLKDLKEHYLQQANNLKCELNDRLRHTLSVNNNTAIGAILPDYAFDRVHNTQAHSVHSIKAQKKILVFWSSGCSHCQTDLPKLIPYYSEMKKRGIEVVGLSLDTDLTTFTHKASAYPWINATELRGWNSSFNEIYNIHATPTYIVVDKDNKIEAKPNMALDVVAYLGLK